jgi:plasmid stabilization system protein ParE
MISIRLPNTLPVKAAAVGLPNVSRARFVTSVDNWRGRRSKMGRARPELRADLRSHSYRNYLIFFRYIGDVIEIVNVLEAHRDISAFFGGDER